MDTITLLLIGVAGIGTPAEDREEERAENRLWNLKEDAKWGKDAEIQKKAIRDLERIGTPALNHLEEVWSIIPPGEMKQYCIDAISRIISRQPSAATASGYSKVHAQEQNEIVETAFSI